MKIDFADLGTSEPLRFKYGVIYREGKWWEKVLWQIPFLRRLVESPLIGTIDFEKKPLPEEPI